MYKIAWCQGYEFQFVPVTVSIVSAFDVHDISFDSYPVTGSRPAGGVYVSQIGSVLV